MSEGVKKVIGAVVVLIITLALFPVEIAFVATAYADANVASYFSNTKAIIAIIPIVLTVGVIIGALYVGYSGFKEASGRRGGGSVAG